MTTLAPSTAASTFSAVASGLNASATVAPRDSAVSAAASARLM
jgi:hypothetical protein